MLSAPVVRRAALLLAVGASAARLIAAPDGTALPMATASRACAYQNTPVRKASPSELRAAVVCLINRARGHWDLPRLRQQSQLDHAAQLHADQMAGDQIFSHRGARGSDPGLRLDL